MSKFLIPYLILSFLAPAFSHAQSVPGEDELLSYFSDAAKNKSGYLSAGVLKDILLPSFLQTVTPRLSDAAPFVRYKAIDIVARKALLCSDSSERQKLTPLLIEACKDPDSGNSGVASKALTQFRRSDFPAPAADSLLTLLRLRTFHYETIIRLAGFLPAPGTVEKLRHMLLNDSSLTRKERWSVRLAMARLGDNSSLDYCMEKIETAGLSDNAVNFLFPDLVYMRQPRALNYVLQGILSDEKYCLSSDPDSENSIICAFKIITLVAPVIQGFPVKLTAYGEPDISDYDAALVQVREWITSHPEYVIISEFY